MSQRMVRITGETLGFIDLLAGLDLEERQQIAGTCRARSYSPDQVVISRDSVSREVFFIISGRLRITIFSHNNKQIMFHDRVQGDIFGELAAIDRRPRLADVIALTDTSLAVISPEDFLQILLSYPKVTEKILVRLVREIRVMTDRVVEYSTLGVNNRIHAELLRLLRTDGQQLDGYPVIAPAPKHADIASRISTHREAVTKELGKLEREGVILKDRGAFVVKDVERLKRMVENAHTERH